MPIDIFPYSMAIALSFPTVIAIQPKFEAAGNLEEIALLLFVCFQTTWHNF